MRCALLLSLLICATAFGQKDSTKAVLEQVMGLGDKELLDDHAAAEPGDIIAPKDTSSKPQYRYEAITEQYAPLKFTGSLRLEFQGSVNGENDKSGPEGAQITIQGEKLLVEFTVVGARHMGELVDFGTKTQHILMVDEQGTQSAMVRRLEREFIVNADTTNNPERAEETRTMEGYTCRKYLFSDAYGTAEIWIAEGEDVDVSEAFRRMGADSTIGAVPGMSVVGVVLESTWTSADGSIKTVTRTKDLKVGKVKKDAFSLDGYTVLDLRAGGK